MPRFCLLLALFGGVLAADFGPTRADEPTLRVMSFNIRYGTASDGDNAWPKRMGHVVRTIADFNPDLLGAQEALAFQVRFLAEQLKDYEVLGVGRDDGKEAGEFSPLYYKKDRFVRLESGTFWLSERPNQPGSKGWDAALPRIVTWARLRDKLGDELWVYNTHFDHRGEKARLESAKLLRTHLAALPPDARFVVLGDFNATENQPPYAALCQGNAGPSVIDAYRALHPQRGEEEATFNGFSGTRKGMRIDWILHSKHFRPTAADIVRTAYDGKYPSDHYPVTAVLAPAK